MFDTPIQARQFFEDRIIQQADVKGVTLSADERLMLKWSESEPDSIADPALAERLAGEISDEDYSATTSRRSSRSGPPTRRWRSSISTSRDYGAIAPLASTSATRTACDRTGGSRDMTR
ncbi:MAG TPA: hypothetical protein VEL79_04725 [Vicinamibacterales bacterium]|nr:hypothetical protein [Vicinamibacterales bacterium]